MPEGMPRIDINAPPPPPMPRIDPDSMQRLPPPVGPADTPRIDMSQVPKPTPLPDTSVPSGAQGQPAGGAPAPEARKLPKAQQEVLDMANGRAKGQPQQETAPAFMPTEDGRHMVSPTGRKITVEEYNAHRETRGLSTQPVPEGQVPATPAGTPGPAPAAPGAPGATQDADGNWWHIPAVGAAALGAGYFLPQILGEQPKTSSLFDWVPAMSREWRGIDYSTRRDVALVMDKEAADFGYTLPREIEQYAGTRMSVDLPGCIQARADQVRARQPEVADAYDELQKIAAYFPPDEVVSTLYLLDDAANLRRLYGNGIVDPVLSVYKKEAASLQSLKIGSAETQVASLSAFRTDPMVRARVREAWGIEMMNKMASDPVRTLARVSRADGEAMLSLVRPSHNRGARPPGAR